MSGLDAQFIQESSTGWMEANASMVQYNGGNKVKIPKISTSGLGNYSKTTGFPSGGVTLEWEERTLTKDRGQSFSLDAMDVNETNFVVQAGIVMGTFQKEHVVPEVDAYRYSQIFQLANAKLRTGSYVLDKATIYDQLKGDISAIQNVIGENEPLVIAISHAAALVLDKSDDIEKHISADDFTNGALQTKVRSLDGIPMFRIPSGRFKSAITLSATDGFSFPATAMELNWVIMSRAAVIAIVKTDKPRIFAPDVNQDLDAWKIQYRKYHDLWILDNKFPAIFVSYTAIAAPALTATVAKATGTGNTKFTATAGSGNTLAYQLAAGDITDPKFNDVPTGLTPYVSGTAIAATVGQHLGMYELDATGHVVKFLEFTLTSGEIT